MTQSQDQGQAWFAVAIGAGDIHWTETPYGPGSFLSEPGGVPHTTEAGPDSECIVLATQRRSLDFNLIRPL